MRGRMLIVLAGVIAMFAVRIHSLGIDEPDEDTVSVPSIQLKMKLRGASAISLQRIDDGSYRYVITEGQGTGRLTPKQFADRLYREHVSRSFLQLLLNITSPIGIAWVALGLMGQVLFTGRMVLQWITSERRRRSVVPVAFWWMSLVGGMMLLTYFLWRKDIVGVMGQSTGVFIYSRNLILIHRRNSKARIARATRHLDTSSVSEETEIELQSP